jgi:hypothetical protein
VQELVRCIRLNLDCADACAAAGRMPARPRPMLASSAQRSKPARRPVAPAARSVTGTPSTTTTVASAPEPAAAASRPATTSSPRPANQTQQRPRSRVGPLAAHLRLAAPALSARRQYLPTGGGRDSLRPAGGPMNAPALATCSSRRATSRFRERCGRVDNRTSHSPGHLIRPSAEATVLYMPFLISVSCATSSADGPGRAAATAGRERRRDPAAEEV